MPKAHVAAEMRTHNLSSPTPLAASTTYLNFIMYYKIIGLKAVNQNGHRLQSGYVLK